MTNIEEKFRFRFLLVWMDLNLWSCEQTAWEFLCQKLWWNLKKGKQTDTETSNVRVGSNLATTTQTSYVVSTIFE